MKGTSTTIDEARAVIHNIREEINNFVVDIPTTYREIDWGPKAQGQGKRSGYMVKGSMSAAPVGVKRYYSIDMSEYKDEDIEHLRGGELSAYYTARKFGCNHIEAKLYALT